MFGPKSDDKTPDSPLDWANRSGDSDNFSESTDDTPSEVVLDNVFDETQDKTVDTGAKEEEKSVSMWGDTSEFGGDDEDDGSFNWSTSRI